MLRIAIAAIFISGCVDYQLSPYAEVRYRDEHFSPPGGASDYGGETFMIGVRYVPPTRISYMAPGVGASSLVASRIPALPVDHTTTINMPKDERPKSDIESIADIGKNKDGDWTGWGICALLVFGFVFKEVWARRSQPKIG